MSFKCALIRSKITLFLFVITLTVPYSILAQNTFTLQGVVINPANKQRVALVKILNKRSKIAVGSNDMGLFSILVKASDTLEIHKTGYLGTELIIKDQKNATIYLYKGNTLREVQITGQSKQKALNELRKEYRSKGSFYGGKPPILAFLFTPLTAFYELFGKTPKQAKRFDSMYQNEMQNNYVDRIFNKVTINQHTGLTGRNLENFMVAYRPSYEQAKNWNGYDGIKWINESYKKYSDTAKIVK